MLLVVCPAIVGIELLMLMTRTRDRQPDNFRKAVNWVCALETDNQRSHIRQRTSGVKMHRTWGPIGLSLTGQELEYHSLLILHHRSQVEYARLRLFLSPHSHVTVWLSTRPVFSA